MKRASLFHLLIFLGAAWSSVTTIAADKDGYPLKKCVVTGEAFGGDLGPPIDVTYKGRTIRLCCKSCVKKFKANPDKYLAIFEAELKKK